MSTGPVALHLAPGARPTPAGARTHAPAPEAERRPWTPVAPPAPRRMDDAEVVHRAALAHVEVLRLAVECIAAHRGDPDLEPFAPLLAPVREYIAAWGAREATVDRAARWRASIELGRVAGELDRAVTVTRGERLLDGIAARLGAPSWRYLLDAAARADLARVADR